MSPSVMEKQQQRGLDEPNCPTRSPFAPPSMSLTTSWHSPTSIALILPGLYGHSIVHYMIFVNR